MNHICDRLVALKMTRCFNVVDEHREIIMEFYLGDKRSVCAVEDVSKKKKTIKLKFCVLLIKNSNSYFKSWFD